MPGRVSGSRRQGHADVGPKTYRVRVGRLRAAYESALAWELAAGRRIDGCATIAELHVAWQVGVARPPVSARTFRAWQLLVDYQMNAGAGLGPPPTGGSRGAAREVRASRERG